MYNSSTLQYEGSWGDKEKEEIFNLLHIEEAGCVIALTSRGLFSFEAEIADARFFDSLEFTKCQWEDIQGLTMSVGVVVHPSLNITKCEVWVCSQTEKRIFILNPCTLDILKEVEFTEREYSLLSTHPPGENMRNLSKKMDVLPLSPMMTVIKDMQVVQVGCRMKMGVADNWMLALWDIESRKLEKIFNCVEYCRDSVSGKP